MKKILELAFLSAFVLAANLHSSHLPGPSPKGEITTNPDTTYYGVGMEMGVTPSNLKDIDCTDADPSEEEEDSIEKVEFSADSGATVTNGTSKTNAKVKMPTSKGTVKITLKVDDKGDKADDGGLTEVATKEITVGKPKSIEYVPPSSQISTPVHGGEFKYLVKDEDGQAFKVAGAKVRESLSLEGIMMADGQPVARKIEDSKKEVVFGSLDDNGNVLDPVGLTLSALSAEADSVGAQSTFRLYLSIAEHTYEVESGTWFSMSGNFPKGIDIQMSKDGSGTWKVDSVGVQPE